MNATATAPTITGLVRDSFKGLGQPQTFYFWGTGKQADDQDGTLVTSVETNLLTLVLKDGRGETVAKFDKRSKFWTSPAGQDDHEDCDEPEAPAALVPAPRPVTRDEAETIAINLDGDPEEFLSTVQVTVKAPRPSRNAKLHDCRCGCKAQIRGLYKQGHDARHAGEVARKAIAAGADADLTAILAELPTEALRTKAANMVASRVK